MPLGWLTDLATQVSQQDCKFSKPEGRDADVER